MEMEEKRDSQQRRKKEFCMLKMLRWLLYRSDSWTAAVEHWPSKLTDAAHLLI